MKRFITALFFILATATTAMAQQIVDDYAFVSQRQRRKDLRIPI